MSKLGFSPSETKVYLHLLRYGASYPTRISSETRINRTNVYEALERLVSRGVVSFIMRNKVKWFEAKDPQSLLSFFSEREEKIQQLKNELMEDIGSLKLPPATKHLEANIFVGRNGLRSVFEEILEAKTPIQLIASHFQFKEFFGVYFDLWHKKRIMNRIEQRSIFPKRFEHLVEKRELLECKFVDDSYTSPTTTIIYGDTCLFIQWSKEPLAIRMCNKDIATSHLNYFNIIWNSQ